MADDSNLHWVNDEDANSCTLPGVDAITEAETAEDDAANPVWGFWMTILLTLMVIGGWLAAQVAVAAVGLVAMITAEGGRDPSAAVERAASHGGLIAVSVVIGTPVAIAMCYFACWLKRGTRIHDYLGIRRPRILPLIGWAVVTVCFLLASEYVLRLLQCKVDVEAMFTAYRTAGVFVPVLWLAVCVGAPVSEEYLFRGFMYEGLARSRVGVPGAVLLTSLVWTAMHTQYGGPGLTVIFLLGILFGVARARTGSMLLCMLLHAGVNTMAMVELALAVAAE